VNDREDDLDPPFCRSSLLARPDMGVTPEMIRNVCLIKAPDWQKWRRGTLSRSACAAKPERLEGRPLFP
tara:strand:- start:642 stop:848 length:207 start_codon:yes stop_codon:yes gene_type:complete